MHGGAFVDGHRNKTEQIYSNVLYYFARHGVVGINVGYRLAGDAHYPGASQDVGAVVQWTRDHAAELNVDPERIYLGGHSTGGTLASDEALAALRAKLAGGE